MEEGHLTYALQLLESLRSTLMDSSLTGLDAWSKLSDGELSMMITTATEAEKHRHPRTKIWMPELQQNLASTWILGRSYAVSSQTDHPDAAGLWISEMTSLYNQARWYETTGNLPVLKTIYYEAARNQLPTWIPATLAAGSGIVLPASPSLPEQLESFAPPTTDFLSGAITGKQYRGRLAELSR